MHARSTFSLKQIPGCFHLSQGRGKKAGFSLVELSIVLVILGLLTGGILAGQSLIRAAELRSVVADLRRYQSAVLTFRDKYFAIPGDMTNATQFWGAADGGAGTGSGCFTVNVASTHTTCNGNGDGYVLTPAGAAGIWANGERFHAWVQLANAGLVEGSYTGITDSASSTFYLTAGKNMPTSRIGQAVYDINSIPSNADVTAYYLYDSNHTNADLQGYNFVTIRPAGDGAASASVGVLKPEEAWNVDTKLDDGKPGTGSVQTTKKTSPQYGNCASSDDRTSATYDFSQTSKNCTLLFRLF